MSGGLSRWKGVAASSITTARVSAVLSPKLASRIQYHTGGVFARGDIFADYRWHIRVMDTTKTIQGEISRHLQLKQFTMPSSTKQNLLYRSMERNGKQ